MTWTDDALCKGMDTELFFEPDREDFPDLASWQKATHAKLKEARKICTGCPVVNTCLRENLNTPFGIFGGTSTRQRRQIARKHGVLISDDALLKEAAPKDSNNREVILDLYRKKHTIADIVSLTGINRYTVSRVVNDPYNWGPDGQQREKKHGYRFQKSWADPKYAQIRELLAQGHGARYIGRETGFCWKIVQRIKYSMQKVQEDMELAK